MTTNACNQKRMNPHIKVIFDWKFIGTTICARISCDWSWVKEMSQAGYLRSNNKQVCWVC